MSAVTDLSALPADELADKVRLRIGAHTHHANIERNREARNALAELVRRASERDQAVERADRLAAALEQIEAYLVDKTADEVDASVVYKVARDARAASRETQA